MKSMLVEKCYDNGDSIKSQALYSFSNYAQNNLTKISLIDLSMRHSRVKLPKPVDGTTFICTLPNRRLFCYGNLWWERQGGIYNTNPSPKISGIAFIVNSDLETEILNEGIPCYKPGGVYCDGKVFLFGGHIQAETNEPTSIASEYNLERNRWRNISNLPISSSGCSCIEYMGLILIGGFSHSKSVFAYDIAEDSYSEFLSNLQKTKFLCKNDGYAYLINPGGNIYESEYCNPFVWKIVNKYKGKIDYEFIAFQTVFGNYFYFVDNHFPFSDCYMFDLVNKEMSDCDLNKLIGR
ncbi:unnamed protein product [Blepharisma stoltei]|uniref:Uncharacterized protein n=1 Tax=Blepharisma stoltei TaxID=1481888 RepID=A0AAU9JE85_9CILI|nr:unnamed protein product [Blepharisma stoltei]